MFIYRQEMYEGPTDKDGNSLEGRAEIIVGKQRNGPTGHREPVLPQAVHPLRELQRRARSPSEPEGQNGLPLHRLRRRPRQVGGALRRVRRVEHARRGERSRACRPRGPAPPGARRARPRSATAAASSRPPRLRDVRGSEERRLEDRHRRIRLRARRRNRPGLDGARRRRARHRQVDAAAAGRRRGCRARDSACSTCPAKSRRSR